MKICFSTEGNHVEENVFINQQASEQVVAEEYDASEENDIQNTEKEVKGM